MTMFDEVRSMMHALTDEAVEKYDAQEISESAEMLRKTIDEAKKYSELENSYCDHSWANNAISLETALQNAVILKLLILREYYGTECFHKYLDEFIALDKIHGREGEPEGLTWLE